MQPKTEKFPCLKYVDFDLPFLLFVEDSLGDIELKEWAESFSSGTRPLPYSPYAPAAEKPSNLICCSGLPVHIPREPLAPIYYVKLPHFSAGIRLLRRVNPQRELVLVGEVPGDRAGRASFSSVRVIFDISRINPKNHQNLPFFCHHAVQAINHFIAHYRVIADRPYVGPVTMTVIQRFNLTSEFEDGEQIQQPYCLGMPLNGMGGAIPDEQDAALRAAIALSVPPSIDETLDTNIRNYLDLQEGRLAVIESAVAFEAWVSRHLREKLLARGTLDIEKLFLDKRGNPCSITNIAKKLVRLVTGHDFGSTDEYAAWSSKVRDLRNDIIHGKCFDVSREQAIQAYDAVRAAIKNIKDNRTHSSRRYNTAQLNSDVS